MPSLADYLSNDLLPQFTSGLSHIRQNFGPGLKALPSAFAQGVQNIGSNFGTGVDELVNTARTQGLAQAGKQFLGGVNDVTPAALTAINRRGVEALRAVAGGDPYGSTTQDLRQLGAPEPVSRWLGAYADTLAQPAAMLGPTARVAGKVAADPVVNSLAKAVVGASGEALSPGSLSNLMSDESTARFGGTPGGDATILDAAQRTGRLGRISDLQPLNSEGTQWSGARRTAIPQQAYNDFVQNFGQASNDAALSNSNLTPGEPPIHGMATPRRGFTGMDIGEAAGADPYTIPHEEGHAALGLTQQNPATNAYASPWTRAISAMEGAPTPTGQALGIMGDEALQFGREGAAAAANAGAGPFGQAIAGAKRAYDFARSVPGGYGWAGAQRTLGGQPYLPGAGALADQILGRMSPQDPVVQPAGN